MLDLINSSTSNQIISIYFFLSILILFIGANLLVNSSSSIAEKLNIPKIIIGLTIVSLATSLPEFFITLNASLIEKNEIAIGNIIGSNIMNISLILGLIAILNPINLTKSEIDFKYLFLLLITSAFSFILISQLTINWIIGCVFIFILIGFNIISIKKSSKQKENQEKKPIIFKIFNIKIEIKNILVLFGIAILSGLILWIGSKSLLTSTEEIAKRLGISDRVISISLLAIGTSLPELIASIYASLKNEIKLAFGNLIGSNIFNILAVIGFTSLISDIEQTNSIIDATIMLSVTTLLFPIFYIKSKNKIDRVEGVILCLVYIIYMIFLFLYKPI